MSKLILVRHGQSEWNLKNLFTGWTDVDLTEQGVAEARAAGVAIKEAGLKFDVAFTSVLKRAVKTLHYIQDETNLYWVDVHKTWRLNERHYGALQGLNKNQTAQQYGESQVQLWRRSFDVMPPLLKPTDERAAAREYKYLKYDLNTFPLGESLKQSIERVMPYWQDCIAPKLVQKQDVIIVAHGNSLRGLVKVLLNISDSAIVNLEIPTGTPQVFELDNELKVSKNYYLK